MGKPLYSMGKPLYSREDIKARKSSSLYPPAGWDKSVDIATLNKSVDDLITFHTMLRGFLLELKDLGDSRVDALFIKYKVEVS